MENLNTLNDSNYIPIKGDNIFLEGRYGIILDESFTQILWTDNNETVEWVGGWSEFLNIGGHILVI
jgi:hypothetical protein